MSHTEPATPLESLAADLTLAVGQLARRLRTQADSGGLNLSQLATLARLEQNGSMTTADLARAEAMKPQSMGTILASLEAQQFVRRRPDPCDGRQVLFALTPKGARMRRQRSAAKREWLAAALARLDGVERRTLISAVPLIKELGAA